MISREEFQNNIDLYMAKNHSDIPINMVANYCYDILVKDLEKKESRIQRLREALEFYGNKESWKTVTVSNHNQIFCIMMADLEYFEEPNQDSYCGRMARWALAADKDEEV